MLENTGKWEQAWSRTKYNLLAYETSEPQLLDPCIIGAGRARLSAVGFPRPGINLVAVRGFEPPCAAYETADLPIDLHCHKPVPMVLGDTSLRMLETLPTFHLVRVRGIEPPTSRSRSVRSTRLSYTLKTLCHPAHASGSMESFHFPAEMTITRLVQNLVGMVGFEPTISCPPDTRPRPD